MTYVIGGGKRNQGYIYITMKQISSEISWNLAPYYCIEILWVSLKWLQQIHHQAIFNWQSNNYSPIILVVNKFDCKTQVKEHIISHASVLVSSEKLYIIMNTRQLIIWGPSITVV